MFKSKKVKVFFATVLAVMILPGTASFAAQYSVVKGDSLYTIGKLFNTTSSSIMKENNLSSTLIYPGQKLTVPAVEHTVFSGDTLYLIAKKYGITLDSLRKANNKWDDIIYPGQKLIVPAAAQGSAALSSKPAVQYTTGDHDLMARLITAEAESEPYNAKVAVGAVVLNRIKDSRFPNTIKDVIYEKSNGYYQFTPVENGWIYKPASESAKQAAYDALNGKDPSNGALFYFDDSATNKWLWSKPLAARIGRMVFVY
jgi:N-acetylmuramoyl-L-alanine amidase